MLRRLTRATTVPRASTRGGGLEVLQEGGIDGDVEEVTSPTTSTVPPVLGVVLGEESGGEVAEPLTADGVHEGIQHAVEQQEPEACRQQRLVMLVVLVKPVGEDIVSVSFVASLSPGPTYPLCAKLPTVITITNITISAVNDGLEQTDQGVEAAADREHQHQEDQLHGRARPAPWTVTPVPPSRSTARRDQFHVSTDLELSPVTLHCLRDAEDGQSAHREHGACSHRPVGCDGLCTPRGVARRLPVARVDADLP